MSDIQQYGARGPLSDPPLLGEYVVVTYADHVAAVAAATENAVRDYAEAHYANGVKRYSDGVKAARRSVAAMRPETDPDIAHVIVSDVLDAIDALEKK